MKRALNYQFFNFEKKSDKRKKQMFKLLVKPMYSNSDTKQLLQMSQRRVLVKTVKRFKMLELKLTYVVRCLVSLLLKKNLSNPDR